MAIDRHNSDAFRRAERAYLDPPEPTLEDYSEEELRQLRNDIFVDNVRDTKGRWSDALTDENPVVEMMQALVIDLVLNSNLSEEDRGLKYTLLGSHVLALVVKECVPTMDEVTDGL